MLTTAGAPVARDESSGDNDIISTWNDPDTTAPWITRRQENAAQPIFRLLPPELLLRIMKFLPAEELYFVRQTSITFQELFSWKTFGDFHAAWDDVCCYKPMGGALPRSTNFQRDSWKRLPPAIREPYVTASLLDLPDRKPQRLGYFKKLSSPPLVAFKFPRCCLPRAEDAVRERLLKIMMCEPCRKEGAFPLHESHSCPLCSKQHPFRCSSEQHWVILCRHETVTLAELEAFKCPQGRDPPRRFVMKTCTQCFRGEEGAQTPEIRFERSYRLDVRLDWEYRPVMSWQMPVMTMAEGQVVTRRLIQDALDSRDGEYAQLLCPHYTLMEGQFSLLGEFYERFAEGSFGGSAQSVIKCPECCFEYSLRRMGQTVHLHGKCNIWGEKARTRQLSEGPDPADGAKHRFWCPNKGCYRARTWRRARGEPGFTFRSVHVV
ncbi:hypothetical protein CPLU01_10009 [Colletotrichum plurivorum]|uniref:F-box domain-containing protein n=1 Tax=Colletotrichum plurivorum TaxID=2175906 RepID=A0A8H6N9Y2_9PEZI|nr:hypothetical protein CPLU01_10009 [Colletotrichum plurivorum]